MTKTKCTICKSKIKTMAFIGTGVCGEICRKKRDGDTPHGVALMHAPNPMMVKVGKTGRAPRVT